MKKKCPCGKIRSKGKGKGLGKGNKKGPIGSPSKRTYRSNKTNNRGK